jgi:hypothetical protein
MKKILFLFASLNLMFTSCSSSDDEDTVLAPVQGEIIGSITNNRTFAFGNYTLTGVVTIESGVTVVFDAGSTITANGANGVDALVVKNGGKLIINGTASSPVVFTENSQIPGSWGGIIMYGDAPINGTGATTTRTSEDGLNLTYGGTNAQHNGGALRYVRVEYAGKKITDGTSEMNGFSFYSVGAGTVLDNLVSYKGADDGFEFYGGNVSATNLISYGNFDDSFDWQDGWRGQNNANWYAFQTGTGNYGMEIEASNNNNTYFPVVENITLIRDANTATENGSAEYDAIQFKKQGNGQFTNVLISGYNTNVNATGVRIQDNQTNNDQVANSRVILSSIKITGPATNFSGVGTMVVNFPTNTFTVNNNATGANLVLGNWARVNGIPLF